MDMALCVAETVTQQEIKRSGLPPGLAANSTHIIKARLMGLIASSTFRNGLTLRQALFEATLPAWNARLSAAFSIVRMRLAVAESSCAGSGNFHASCQASCARRPSL